MNDINRLWWILGGLAIALAIFLATYSSPEDVTNEQIDKALIQVQALDNPPPVLELSNKDGWGHPLVFHFSHDTKTLTYTVLSKGKDGIEGTPDDISKSAIDHNISRMVGEWTAEKAKEFFKGVKDGATKKSKYEESK